MDIEIAFANVTNPALLYLLTFSAKKTSPASFLFCFSSLALSNIGNKKKAAIKSDKFVVFFVLARLEHFVFGETSWSLSTRAEAKKKREIVKHMKSRFSQVNCFPSSQRGSHFVICVLIFKELLSSFLVNVAFVLGLLNLINCLAEQEKKRNDKYLRNRNKYDTNIENIEWKNLERKGFFSLWGLSCFG